MAPKTTVLPASFCDECGGSGGWMSWADNADVEICFSCRGTGRDRFAGYDFESLADLISDQDDPQRDNPDIYDDDYAVVWPSLESLVHACWGCTDDPFDI